MVYQGEDTLYSCTDLHRHSNYKFRVCLIILTVSVYVCMCVCMYVCVYVHVCARAIHYYYYRFLHITVYHCILLYISSYCWLLQVCAVNSAGTGPSSSVVECTTLPDLPGCPLNLSSKERPTTTSLHIQWGQLFDDRGIPSLYQ